MESVIDLLLFLWNCYFAANGEDPLKPFFLADSYLCLLKMGAIAFCHLASWLN